ncbi:MAG: cyclase [Gammaproteobacteria bacterium]|jgi:cyclase
MKTILLLSLSILLVVPGIAGAGPFEIEFEELAPGIWAGIRPDSSRFPVMGSTTFVISDVGVVVFDGGGVPVIADQVIEKIRSETDLPVTHVIISHWHGDHNFGIYRYGEEFSNVQFIAHTFTHAAMNGSPIDYILGYPEFVSKNLPGLKQTVESGKHPDGNDVSAVTLANYKRRIEDAPEIDIEYKKVQVTTPNVIFEDQLVIYSGKTRIELMKLGHGNTEGDIVMWLPQTRIVAAGDLVVLPAPYAFNVPPLAWAASLERLKDLGFEILVPGHGEIQNNITYVDLLIESANSIAQQRDALLAQGLSKEEVESQLDFSALEERFTEGDKYKAIYFKAWFERPFRKAAIKALSNEPMVKIEPHK